jgi:hypothetical protein
VLTWITLEIEDLGLWLLRFAGARRRRKYEVRPAPSTPAGRPHPIRADERTIHRIAEAERGGLSTEASAALYESGENPGGLHHKAVRREGPEHPRPKLEEPQERKERVPRGERHIPVVRRGG